MSDINELRHHYGEDIMELSNKVQYYKKYPSSFAEDVCGVKLTKWQKYMIDNIDKISIRYNARNSYKRLMAYYHLCSTYINMKDNEYIAIVSPDKVERLNKDELLKYIEKYWK